jgi:hypothetical protein
MRVGKTRIQSEHVTALAWVLAFFIAFFFGIAVGGLFAFVAGMFGFYAAKQAIQSYLENF